MRLPTADVGTYLSTPLRSRPLRRREEMFAQQGDSPSEPAVSLPLLALESSDFLEMGRERLLPRADDEAASAIVVAGMRLGWTTENTRCQHSQRAARLRLGGKSDVRQPRVDGTTRPGRREPAAAVLRT